MVSTRRPDQRKKLRPMKVAILGTVPVSRTLAPFDDKSWEIWCCSPGNRAVVPRVTRWFELHGIVDMMGPENDAWRGDYFAWLKTQSFPVYMQEQNELLPQVLVFPIKDLLTEFGRFGRMSFTSSISLMIAFAIQQGATEIGIYGVDMAANEEAYSSQKAGCLNMMWLADQRGIKVTVPLESCLATLPPLYGYAEASRMGRRMVVKEMEAAKAVTDLDATIARLTAEKAYFNGALETTRYMRRTFVDGENDAELDLPEVKAPEEINAANERFPTINTNRQREWELHERSPVQVPDYAAMRPERVHVDKTAGGVLVPRLPHVEAAE